MRICVACGSTAVDEDWRCAACSHQPPVLDGVRAFAPDLADSSEGFDAAFFPELARMEESHFWFRARNELIAWALRTYAGSSRHAMEVGCGTGFVLRRMARELPGATVIGSEVFAAGLRLTAARVPDACCYQMDARHIPFRDAFDVIGAFDVIEHIAEDRQVVAEVARALRPGGVFMATVPQHGALWSDQDVHAHHVRRYSRSRFGRLLTEAGLEPVRITSFVSLLLPAMVASRVRLRSSQQAIKGVDALRVPEPLNALFGVVMGVERALIRHGVSFQAGGSLLVVARKPRPVEGSA